jgi:hypothetical protein
MSPLVVPPLGSGACDPLGLGSGACDALGVDAVADPVGAAETDAGAVASGAVAPALPQAVTTSPMAGMRTSRPSLLAGFE